MSSRLAGKVAFITGAARGQGRAHAVRMAEEGADIIAVDICEQIKSNKYPLATQQDLDETTKLVTELGAGIVAVKADVRERDQLREAVEAGIAQFGRLDIVVANAGILPMALGDPHASDFVDSTDVDLVGVMNAVAVAIAHLGDGGSIIVTGSTAGMMPGTTSNPVMGPGGAGYSWSKKTLIGYVEEMSVHLAPRFIRVNAIHPTNVNTHLMHNDGMYGIFRPDLEHPTREDVEPAFTHFQAMPIPYIEPVDVANLAVFLASDEARYITGQQIRVDAGALVKFPNGPTSL
ncbi:mycofactocin-coupled SDR family oxidoreductase [Mycolicibacter algericus]|jgi:SDR family mycofactocin-dependent oxidoreductase|uniref:3-ketoacyl-ACP reductase n=2 Tax=Mycolicibacter algericus TaxID=1288388 RepID=A0A7I9Y5M0_MYCAL|nr:mycofactocin-coupled SDR family oxidoreductase [Mycolicibacter algericus]OQZ95059.1 3-ketoacyl-ACP reductase [Mycolicibacter algericus DSM 45454]GFG83975.1 3-ketoacyl-ACP reductase [Mycolicibacter algericus]